MKKYILAFDQGTTSSRCIVFDMSRGGIPIGNASKEFPQIFPADGWVEHDPADILNTQIESAKNAMALCGAEAKDVAAIGITNQRETTVVWDRSTGEPIYNAIVWQCRRTAEDCNRLQAEGAGDMIHQKTGLIPDAYFSGTKLKWILDHGNGARQKAQNGSLMFGTVDSWLIYNLTGRKAHVTDVSNASRTMLFNIHTMDWDEELLKLLGIPRCILPQVLPSCALFGYTDKSWFGAEIPIMGVAGDQQAALFGQCCFDEGECKNTYGTGGFMLMNTGNTPILSKAGLLTTIAWKLDGKVTYALEGSVFICGAAIQWLRDGLQLFNYAYQSEEMARSVSDCGGVYFVPAFVGLGAPYWDPYARGLLIGLSRATGRGHVVRAVLESMAYQTLDVLKVMERESHNRIPALKVDGGACANNLLMEFQADILNIPVIRPQYVETTAMGAAHLAALGAGIYTSTEEIKKACQAERSFLPSMPENEKEIKLAFWHKAVARSLDWAK